MGALDERQEYATLEDEQHYKNRREWSDRKTGSEPKSTGIIFSGMEDEKKPQQLI